MLRVKCDGYGDMMRADQDDAVLQHWATLFERTAAERESCTDGSHDLSHARRVWRLADRLGQDLDEPVDRLVLLAAAYLHDAVSLEKNDPRRSQASRLAAEFARTFLAEISFPPELIEPVAHAVEAHSYSAGVPLRTIEAKLLQDADRIEALGAIGIARTFYVAGRMGSALFDPADPLARERALDDRRFALDHFQTKLLKLPDTMTTSPGRAVAAVRAAVLERFVENLLLELDAQ